MAVTHNRTGRIGRAGQPSSAARPTGARRQAETPVPLRRLAVVAGLTAGSAYGGAAGLATGGLELGRTVTHRLPAHSPVLGGIALALIVAVPCTWLAWLAWRGDRRAGRAQVTVGLLLMGWIAVELAFIREFSFLHPLFFWLGAILLVRGLLSSSAPPR